MKLISLLTFFLLIGCSMMNSNKVIDWEEIALLNGHHYFEDQEVHEGRVPSQEEKKEADTCSDQTQEEIADLDDFILKFDGKIVDADDYDHSMKGLQSYLEDSGVTRYFSAKEMITPNSKSSAQSCGYEELLPSRCRWKSAVAQGLLAVKLRGHINKDRTASRGIKIRNWWRPSCYNKKVGGAGRSDHMQARGFDLDFSTAKDRAVAQEFLCSMYKEAGTMSLQVGIGCYTLHVGIGSPKRLSRYPEDGARFWKYGSLKTCSVKRISKDDCWKVGRDNKLHIYTEVGSGIL